VQHVNNQLVVLDLNAIQPKRVSLLGLLGTFSSIIAASEQSLLKELGITPMLWFLLESELLDQLSQDRFNFAP